MLSRWKATLLAGVLGCAIAGAILWDRSHADTMPGGMPAVNMVPSNCAVGGGLISTGTGWSCSAGVQPILPAATASIGGSLLLAGACTTGTANVSGATVGMVSAVEPASYPGAGVYWQSRVTSANTVTVYVCGVIAVTPSSTTYQVRVIQ